MPLEQKFIQPFTTLQPHNCIATQRMSLVVIYTVIAPLPLHLLRFVGVKWLLLLFFDVVYAVIVVVVAAFYCK